MKVMHQDNHISALLATSLECLIVVPTFGVSQHSIRRRSPLLFQQHLPPLSQQVVWQHKYSSTALEPSSIEWSHNLVASGFIKAARGRWRVRGV